MDIFIKRLQELLDKKDWKQKELAKKTGVTEVTISRYLSGERSPRVEVVKQIAEALNVSTDYLLGNSNIPNESMRKKGIRINVYGSIPAGIPIETIEDIDDWEEIPEEWTKGGKKYIALKVKGDSMYPKYLEGDIVIVLLQSDFTSGQDVIAYVNGFEATLKTAIRNIDGSITLRPINPNYAPKTYCDNDDPVKVLGVVKQLRRPI